MLKHCALQLRCKSPHGMSITPSRKKTTTKIMCLKRDTSGAIALRFYYPFQEMKWLRPVLHLELRLGKALKCLSIT